MLGKLSVVSGISISLENVNTLAILGDNGVGKTAFLEKIALVDEKNLEIVGLHTLKISRPKSSIWIAPDLWVKRKRPLRLLVLSQT